MTNEEMKLINEVKEHYVKDHKAELMVNALIEVLDEKGIIDKHELDVRANQIVDKMLIDQFNELSEDERRLMLKLSSALDAMNETMNDENNEKDTDVKIN